MDKSSKTTATDMTGEAKDEKKSFSKFHKRTQHSATDGGGPKSDGTTTTKPKVRRALLQPEEDREALLDNWRNEQTSKRIGREMTQDLEEGDAGEKGPSSLFFCKSCNVHLKDSQAYIDHINGKNHYKALGMSMVVERVGLDRVKERLAGLKRRKDDRRGVQNPMEGPGGGVETLE